MISRLYYVSCDGCFVPCGGGDDACLDAREARAFAKRSGWTRVPKRPGSHPQGSHRGGDFCPNCAAKRS